MTSLTDEQVLLISDQRAYNPGNSRTQWIPPEASPPSAQTSMTSLHEQPITYTYMQSLHKVPAMPSSLSMQMDLWTPITNTTDEGLSNQSIINKAPEAIQLACHHILTRCSTKT